MILDKTCIIPNGARDTIDELQRESELKPILGIKKRLVFVTNLLRAIGVPEVKGYYLLAHAVERGYAPSKQASANPGYPLVSSCIDSGAGANVRPVRWRRLLTKKRNYTIGRGPLSSDLTFDDPFVSKKHCRLTYDRNSWRIVDLNSRNGVRVNYVLIKQKYLRSGDIIDLSSKTILIFINTLLLSTRS